MDFSKFNNEFMNMQTMIMKYNNQVNDIKVRIKNNSKEINRYEAKIKSTKKKVEKDLYKTHIDMYKNENKYLSTLVESEVVKDEQKN